MPTNALLNDASPSAAAIERSRRPGHALPGWRIPGASRAAQALFKRLPLPSKSSKVWPSTGLHSTLPK